MPRTKRQPWRTGSVFLLPLADGSSCVGQVLSREPDALNSVEIALFDIQATWEDPVDLPELDGDRVFSRLLVTKDLLNSGRWKVVASREVPAALFDGSIDALRSRGFVGAKILGSGIVEEFANAFYGLMPWDDWYIPNFLDDFLISIDKKPVGRLKYCGRHG